VSQLSAFSINSIRLTVINQFPLEDIRRTLTKVAQQMRYAPARGAQQSQSAQMSGRVASISRGVRLAAECAQYKATAHHIYKSELESQTRLIITFLVGHLGTSDRSGLSSELFDTIFYQFRTKQTHAETSSTF
jgi:hypothetical protein